MSKAKDKGRRAEHDIVRRHLEVGVQASRVPLSGSLGGVFSDDVDLPYGKGEIKARANGAGWKTLVKWMKTCDALFLKEDRKDPLVVLPWKTYAMLVQAKFGVDTATQCVAYSSPSTNVAHHAPEEAK